MYRLTPAPYLISVDNFLHRREAYVKTFLKNKSGIIHKVIHNLRENVHKIRLSARFIIPQEAPEW